jgi:hypothetical protein
VVGLEAVGRPNALDRRLAHSLGLGHATRAPVGRTWWLGLCRGFSNSSDAFGIIFHRTASARCDLSKGFETSLLKPIPPEDDGGTADPNPSGNPAVRQAVGCQKSNLGPHDHALRCIPGTNPSFKSLALPGGNCKRITWFPHKLKHNISALYCKAICETLH